MTFSSAAADEKVRLAPPASPQQKHSWASASLQPRLNPLTPTALVRTELEAVDGVAPFRHHFFSMRWYYGTGGKTRGPVEEAALEALELSGDIEWTTPIWREGMSAWQPLGEIFGRPSVTCHECKRTVDKEATVHYRNLWICPRCKNSYFRQVLEGTANEEAKAYCGFWIRVCARLLDILFLSVFTVPLSLANEFLTLRMFSGAEARGATSIEDLSHLGNYLSLQALLALISFALAFGYETFFVGRFAGTPGKLLLGMRVVRSDFSRVSYWRATVRAFGKLLSDLTLYIGYLMVVFDPQRRALHDYIADTRVIKRAEAAPPGQT